MTSTEYTLFKKILDTLQEIECEQIYQRDAVVLIIDMIQELGRRKNELSNIKSKD
jgi:hypothetical protein